MKSTSPFSSAVRMEARSPACSIAGPEVMRMLASISAAMISESDVLPSPGGPKSSTWSSASPRFLAASNRMLRLPLTVSCPI